ncbi:Galactose-3-O-sulfotransferase 2 [Bulinus truncatus]|nr:Galactose-3-O-sulfotransferase 2 [Bulinus truncatus]
MDNCWGYKSRCFMAIVAVALGTIYLVTNNSRTFQDSDSINLLTNVLSAFDKSRQRPQLHIYYLKNHKTASTTVYSILAEYCRSHELTPLLPADVHINQRPPFHPSQVMTFPNVLKYDMVFSHHIYSDEILTYLPNDTFKFTTLREPLKQFISSFVYFRQNSFPYLSVINSTDPLKTFLDNPERYEAKGYHSYTNNRQSMDLGFDMSHRFDDITYIRSFIELTEKRFNLVLISEYFDESLIVLKRRLRWSTTDIIYFRKLESRDSVRMLQGISDLQKSQHKRFSTADIMLYEYFFKKFKKIMSQEVGLSEELEEFQSILSRVSLFCKDVSNVNAELREPAGRWSEDVIITRSKCKWLILDEISFTKYFKMLHINKRFNNK